MGIREDNNMSCVVNNIPKNKRVSRSGADADPLWRVESAKRLVDWGFSPQEIEELGLAEPTLRAIYEYTRLKKKDGSQPSSKTVEAMLEVIAEETQKADIELEMQVMRKRALTNRAKLLQKLARMLQRRESSSLL